MILSGWRSISYISCIRYLRTNCDYQIYTRNFSDYYTKVIHGLLQHYIIQIQKELRQVIAK